MIQVNTFEKYLNLFAFSLSPYNADKKKIHETVIFFKAISTNHNDLLSRTLQEIAGQWIFTHPANSKSISRWNFMQTFIFEESSP